MALVAALPRTVTVYQFIKPGILTAVFCRNQQITLCPASQSFIYQQQRHGSAKHWKPEFKRLRTLKYIKYKLPNLNEKYEDLSPDEMKSRMKERGMMPPRPWLERPYNISSTGGSFEPYVPPEGDGKKSFISKTGAKQKFEFLEKKSKSMLAVRKIRSFEEDFSADIFAEQAQEIYIQAHERMSRKDKYQLREVVTERAYPEMMHNIKDKTIHWKFLKSLEPPRVVHARCTDIITKENIFGQVTVRFHTQQQLAIYDRFGRLMHGSEILTKDVLEYVIFEKHLANEYGAWRLHDKIIPDWLPPKDPAPITFRVDDSDDQVEETLVTESVQTSPTEDVSVGKNEPGSGPTEKVVTA